MATHLNPLISVLLPVYNSEAYLSDAIESILSQTFINFELIILNDGSTDNSEAVISEFKDHRIIYIHSVTNEGLINTLNKGIDLCRGKYIARMDADDVSAAERLQLQYDLMENNPDVIVCGTGIINFDINKKEDVVNVYENDTDLKVELIFSCPFAHPTVLIRTDIIHNRKIRYNQDFKFAEDYELWTRLCNEGKMRNINLPLLRYRKHANQVSEISAVKQQITANKIRKNYLQLLKINFTESELEIHNIFCTSEKLSQLSLFKTSQWLKKLVQQLSSSTNNNTIREHVKNHWLRKAYQSRFNTGQLLRFLISPITWTRPVNIVEVLRITTRQLLQWK